MSNLSNFYISQIEDRFVPYWLKFIDKEYGGILNCITNDGERLISNDKFSWSQGRWLYILSLLLEMKDVFSSINYSQIEEAAEKTASFLTKYSYNEAYHVTFKSNQKGMWLKDERGKYFSSIYADCFVAIGLSEYSKVTNNKAYGAIALKITNSILKRIDDGKYNTEPYPIPDGYSSHGIYMILTNLLEVTSSMLEAFNLDSAILREKQLWCVNTILSKHLDNNRLLIREYVSSSFNDNLLLDRHINPGHTLEDMWFMIECFEHNCLLNQKLSLICEITKAVTALGWDKEYGGLLRFVDIDGGRPKGIDSKSDYENLISSTWDMKLWWPHSEMLYLYRKLYVLTKDKDFDNYYKMAFDYSFSTFPSTNNGEWVQIRDRKGEPIDKVVALPVKDPFHIMRDFLKIIKLEEK